MRKPQGTLTRALTALLCAALVAPSYSQSVRVRPHPVEVAATPTGFSPPLLVDSAHAAPQEGAPRFVIRYRDGSATAAAASAGVSAMASQVAVMGARAGVNLAPVRVMSEGSLLISAARAMDAQEQRATALRIQASDPRILSVEPDVRVTAMDVSVSAAGVIQSYNDPYAPQQWTHRSRVLEPGGANYDQAHKRSDGQGVLVAVVDTGTTKHPDAQGQYETPGYDFVSDTAYAGDGGGRDADPTDAGDFCSKSNSASSWHGTAVASQIGGVANNNYGIVGSAPSARLMHARVLGRCGGWLSDTADALYWLSGRALPGVPALAERPRVVNLSLGGAAACYSYLQQAVDAANAAGIVVIAAAGNDGANQLNAPANCQGVIAVGAHTQSGDLASYSNFATGLTLTGPGGGACKTQTGAACRSTPTIAAGTKGASVFEAHMQARYFNGTSAATPHVSGAVALLLAVAPSLTPAQVKTALQSSATRHGSDTFCAVAGRCGAGMLDADALLSTAAAPLMSIDVVSGISRTSTTEPKLAGLARKNSLVSLKVSNAGRNIAWKQISGPAQAFATTNSIAAVQLRTGGVAGVVELEMASTDSTGKQQRVSISYRVNDPPTFVAPSLVPGKEGAAYSTNTPLPERDSDGDLLTYALSGTVPAGLTMNARGQLSWAKAVAGVYSLMVTASDPYGQTAQGSMTLQITKVAVVPPPTVNTGVYTGRASVAASLPVVVKVAAGRTVKSTAVGMPSGMTFNGSLLNWPKPVQGKWNVTVSAADSGGQASQGLFTFDIRPANRAPVMSAMPKAAASTATPFSGKALASDADGDPLNFSLQSGPSGFVVQSSGVLSWSAPRVGTHSVVVKVTDGYGGQAVGTLTLVVTSPNLPPTQPTLPKLPALVSGMTLSMTVTASDPNGDKLTYSLAGAPVGMTLSGNVIRWQNMSAGTYRMTVLVRDPGGLSASAPLELTVVQANRAPVFSLSTSTDAGKVVNARDPAGLAAQHTLTLTVK